MLILLLSLWLSYGQAEICPKKCSGDQICYAGHPAPCGPTPDVQGLARCLKKKVGDNQCHKKCEKNSDCPSGQSCTPVELFSGDVQEFQGKLCIFLPS